MIKIPDRAEINNKWAEGALIKRKDNEVWVDDPNPTWAGGEVYKREDGEGSEKTISYLYTPPEEGSVPMPAAVYMGGLETVYSSLLHDLLAKGEPSTAGGGTFATFEEWITNDGGNGFGVTIQDAVGNPDTLRLMKYAWNKARESVSNINLHKEKEDRSCHQ